uniref:Uncharacterized protein n=1 Tax=Anguilla anguilla TaxID=7936 RepID=A0A0E9RLM3_ANGAN
MVQFLSRLCAIFRIHNCRVSFTS